MGTQGGCGAKYAALATQTAKPLKIAITGATGLVGRTLAVFLATSGHQVIPVVRRMGNSGDAGRLSWDPDTRKADRSAWQEAGLDAVVHLSGENIAGKRWSAEQKNRIVRSRTESTAFLAETLASLDPRPAVLVSASAVGFYHGREEARATESTPAGAGFLAETAVAWEAAAEPAHQAGIRVVHPRFGVILSSCGGALAKMLPIFRLGLGGRLGSGQQPMSWVSLADTLRAIAFLIEQTDVSGPVNLVAPGGVTNAEFTRILGRVLHRPTWFPVPASVIGLLLGEMGRTLLLEGESVEPARLKEMGFDFRFPDLDAALTFELQR